MHLLAEPWRLNNVPRLDLGVAELAAIMGDPAFIPKQLGLLQARQCSDYWCYCFRQMGRFVLVKRCCAREKGIKGDPLRVWSCTHQSLSLSTSEA